MKAIGNIHEIWRYPVKSMQGEKLDCCQLGSEGIPGDRGWAIREEKEGEIQGAKRIPRLLLCQARYLEEPAHGKTPPVEITFPAGNSVTSEDSTVHEVLSVFLGNPVTLWPIQPADRTDHYRRSQRTDDAAFRELLSREPDEPLPDLSPFPPTLVEELFEYVSPLGTYFDVAPLHLLTTASLTALGALLPNAQLDSRRFRPNFFVRTPSHFEGFVEFNWSQKTVQIGHARMTCGIPVPRCGMTTHEQPGLPKDSSILRAIVKQVNQNLGIYGSPASPGAVKVGDAVHILD